MHHHFGSPYIRVIVLTYRAHSSKGLGVLVGLDWIYVMEGGRIFRILVAKSEVHPHSEVNQATTHDVVQERVSWCNLHHKAVTSIGS